MNSSFNTLRMMQKEDVWKNFKPESGRQHVSFEGERALLPELRILGWLKFSRAFGQALEADIHPQEYEIHYIVNGELNWWIEDNYYSMRSGMVMIVKPNENHGSRDGVLEPCEHYWLRISFPEQGSLPGLDNFSSRLLREAFESFKNRTFSVTNAVRDQFSILLKEHRERSTHSNLVCRAALHQLLVQIIREYKVENKEATLCKITSAIEESKKTIEKNLSSPPSIERLAKIADMSETTFRKRFRKEVGCSPLDYVNRRRVEKAKYLLIKQDSCIKEISHRLGFSSRQYFSTVFKRVTGLSPGLFIGNRE